MYRAAIQQAIKIIGSQKKLAKICNVSQQCVSSWLKRGCIPPKHVLKIEKSTQGTVNRNSLRPDIYPPTI